MFSGYLFEFPRTIILNSEDIFPIESADKTLFIQRVLYYKSINNSQSENILLVFPRESDHGNVEYKRDLSCHMYNIERMEQLATQLLYRLHGGNGQAWYELGIEDDGTINGQKLDELFGSLRVLWEMCKRIQSNIDQIRLLCLNEAIDTWVSEVKIIQYKSTCSNICEYERDLGVCFLGDSNCGKTTLIASICYQLRDNGSGSARLNTLRHRHEILNDGRSSSISFHYLAWNGRCMGMDDLGMIQAWQVDNTNQLCSGVERRDGNMPSVVILDCPGHSEYLNTTLLSYTLFMFGTNYSLTCLLIDVSSYPFILTDMTKGYLSVLVGSRVPFCIIATKTDLIVMDDTKVNDFCIKLRNAVSHISNMIFFHAKKDSIDHHIFLYTNSSPVFFVSNVTWSGLDILRYYLHKLSLNYDYNTETYETGLLSIQDVLFNSPQSGTVVLGRVEYGQLECDNVDDIEAWQIVDNWPLSPDAQKKYVHVHEMRRFGQYIRTSRTGQYVTLLLSGNQQSSTSKYTHSSLVRGQYLVFSKPGGILPHLNSVSEKRFNLIGLYNWSPCKSLAAISGHLIINGFRQECKLHIQNHGAITTATIIDHTHQSKADACRICHFPYGSIIGFHSSSSWYIGWYEGS